MRRGFSAYRVAGAAETLTLSRVSATRSSLRARSSSWRRIRRTSLGWGPRAYNGAIDLYRTIGFRVGEILLFGAVLYHALNGLRVITMDFWPRTNLQQKRLFYGAVAIFVVFYIPVIVWMVNWMRR